MGPLQNRVRREVNQCHLTLTSGQSSIIEHSLRVEEMQVVHLHQCFPGDFDAVATRADNTFLQKILVGTELESEWPFTRSQRKIGMMLGIESQMMVSLPIFHQTLSKMVK